LSSKNFYVKTMNAIADVLKKIATIHETIMLKREITEDERERKMLENFLLWIDDACEYLRKTYVELDDLRKRYEKHE